MELKKLTRENIVQVLKLTVENTQKSFVADNNTSILEAYLVLAEGGVALPFGIYEDTTLVGFVMFGYDSIYGDDPEIAKGNYCIWRFMIDKQFQNKGYGRKAMKVILDYLRTFPCGKAEVCWLSYEPENTAAKHLYESLGFRETGGVCDGEIIASIKL